MLENKQRDIEKRSVFGLSVLAGQQNYFPGSWSVSGSCNACSSLTSTGPRYRCRTCEDFHLCEECQQKMQRERARVREHEFTHPVTLVHQSMQVFKEMPSDQGLQGSRQWRLYVDFSEAMQAHLSKIRPACIERNATPGVSDASLVLLRDLPTGAGAKVYVSIHPFNAENTHFIGGILPQQPFLQIEWAKLLLTFWRESASPLIIPQILLAVRLGPIAAVAEKLRSEPSLYPLGGAASSSMSAAPLSFSGSSHPDRTSPLSFSGGSDSQVIVCFGEFHPFPVDDRVTYRDLLARAAKRFNVDPVQYELQDSNYAALNLDAPVHSSQTGLIRLAPTTTVDPMFTGSSSSRDW